MRRWYYDLRWKTERRWYQARLWWHMRHRSPEQCEHPGCKQDGIPCFLPDYGESETLTADSHYCPEHAKQYGFCYGCGQFWGGVETFEFAHVYNIPDGLCENCGDEVRREYEWDGYDDDGYDDEAYAESEVME